MTRRHGDSDVWQFDTSPCHRVVIPAPPAFYEAVEALGITMAADEPLARHTTFHIGGPADLYAAVDDLARLERLAETAAAHAVPFTVLGGGSNILVSDCGMRGLVIANQAREFRLAPAEEAAEGEARGGRSGPLAIAAAGTALAGLARWTVKQGLAGLEWAVSVPGTVGGAVIGNAGAHGGDIAGVLAWALVWYPDRGRVRLTADELAFAYRTSLLKQQLGAGGPLPVVLEAAFRLTPGDAAEIATRAEAFLARRRATQPTEPSAGSIFRNPPGDHAGRLIEAAGLKGRRVGGAQISPRHANFIVNVEHATANDVVALIDLCRQRVFEQFGVELMPEIQFLGDWPVQPPYKALFTR